MRVLLLLFIISITPSPVILGASSTDDERSTWQATEGKYNLGIKLDEVSFEAYKILRKRDFFFPEKDDDWMAGGMFNINTHIHDQWFWNNTIHLSGDSFQIRHVGWEFELGYHLIKDSVNVYYYHFSEHETERRNTPIELHGRDYPVQDYIGAKVYLFKGNNKARQ